MYGPPYSMIKPDLEKLCVESENQQAAMWDIKKHLKVLIMDKVTVKVMSYSCKMADITEEGVSLVEDLFRRRQPLPSMDAIYFIQPTKEK
ncbi:SNARE-interacting protein KEULE-like isoform X2 [Macadamia integrifolia]|uniref:SNARE-interacting protein KEULE-like isoform X2 n=1 Tax=Macadamia integrifolia TaxID=60698 RepID=UPI001C52B66F|nr:SNARE-interacting protein KEULE-like isoform X2 [Macadamia integrifolia]